MAAVMDDSITPPTLIIEPAKARKGGKVSPTQRSLKVMRERGYLCQVVERWSPFAKVRIDLYGFIDILCVKGEEIVGVQATTGAHAANRVTKIVEHENWPFVCKAIKVVVHGWTRSSVDCRWRCREIEL